MNNNFTFQEKIALYVLIRVSYLLSLKSLVTSDFLKKQEKIKKNSKNFPILKTFPFFTIMVDINNLNIYKYINNFKIIF